MMAPYLAEELEIPKVVIPGIPPGNFSAWGLLMSDLRHSVVQTHTQRLDNADSLHVFNSGFAALEKEVLEIYRAEGFADGVDMERAADLRYYGQEHTINVPITAGKIEAQELAEICSHFNDHHQREYGFTLPSPVEMVNLRVSGVVKVSKPAAKRISSSGGSVADALIGERAVYWGGASAVRTPIYNRNRLPLDGRLKGPAILEEASTTIIVPHGFETSIDDLGSVILWRAEA